jgi:hypothetical protein
VKFHFCTANHHPGAVGTLTEQMAWLTEGLEGLGHTVTYSKDRADPEAHNILWECFHPDFAADMVRSGHKYIIVATEIPDGGGWNGIRLRPWRQRWRGFKVAAEGAEAIWSLIPEAVPLYRKMGYRATYLEYGFAESLVLKGRKEKDIDFFFYGGGGDHRIDRINALAKSGFKAWHPGTIIPPDLRDSLLRRSKVVLGLKYTPEWKHTSASRIGRAILGNCAVAHEWTESVLRPAHLVPMASKDSDWVEFASAVRDKAKLFAESAIERYRIEMPIKRTMQAALEGVA